MKTAFLINRIKLQFDTKYADKEPKFSDLIDKPVTGQLSAILSTENDRFLWSAADEEVAIECLEKLDDGTYRNHQRFALEKLLDNFVAERGEVDIEGLDFDGQYLWLVGSHSSKRIKAKDSPISGKKLTIDTSDVNRYLLARIPLVNGKLVKVHQSLHSAYLNREGASNELTQALAQNKYLRDILSIHWPGKDNGLDIEGLAIHKNKIFLGLRGPVLRGVAILVEIEVEGTDSELLTLKKIGENNEEYKLHFLDLNGLGIRDLCFDKNDLLILAGPTMDLDASLLLFRLKDPIDLKENSFSKQEKDQLELLFEIPHELKSDRAEGITFYTDVNHGKSLLVVYDTPSQERISEKDLNVFADVFRLP